MPFIILDRDGVINYDSSEYIKSPDEWKAIPGSLEAIAQLNRAGFHVLVITNQSGIARGYYDIETLDRIHEKLIHELATVGGHIEAFFFCPHLPLDNCKCRKPAPGLFHYAEAQFDLDFSNTFFIGDSFSDIQAAINSGCQPILVLTGNGQKTLAEHPECENVICFPDLLAAADYIVHSLKC